MSMLGTGPVASVKLKGHQTDSPLTMSVWLVVSCPDDKAVSITTLSCETERLSG